VQFTDYYAVLQVHSDATEGEVRAAFRRMAKKYHPDVNAHRKIWAHRQMQQILSAYGVLSDKARRAAYDEQCRWYENSQRDRYRERLAAKGDPESRARLVLHDLLQGNADEAVAAYEAALAGDTRFDVRDHLDPRDWMDCKFLLAEEYERRQAHVRALHLYEEVYFHRLARVHYKHFMSVVAERIRNLCCRDLARAVTPEEAVRYFERALSMDLKRPERAFLHKKIAESYERLGENAKAVEQMRRALELKPDLKGCRKICQKLGMMPVGPAGATG
jgi:tetratricopeptide (TPR) repeat protein